MASDWKVRHTPTLVVCLREGYGRGRFLADLGAGLTVAVIALPLSMALGIASIPLSTAAELAAIHPWLTPPAMGLFTAVVAGFIVSALGGSRFQIGGPTAAFMPLVFTVCVAHGYEGLALATLMAGVILIMLGVFRLGGVIKFVPYPVTTGFTAGIGVVIMVSQIKDFFGLSLIQPDGSPVPIPAEVIGKLEAFWHARGSFSPQAFGVGLGSLGVMMAMRRFAPRIPGAIVAVGLAAVVVKVMGWSSATVPFDGEYARPIVETIGTRFGGIPSSLPKPHVPTISFEMVRALIPAATAIAFLGAIESLLSAVVADGMTGYRHRSDQELVAQGAANIASSIFWGLPATGAIARTAANIRSGGQTPIAGCLHAAFILVFMLALAPLAREIPLASLAAILLIVAWNISDIDHIPSLFRGPKPDALVWVTTFGLTVFVDLTAAVSVGIILASILFMRRMAQLTTVNGLREDLEEGAETERHDPKDPGTIRERAIPPGVEVYEINGPFFFGTANKLRAALDQFEKPPKVIILRMRYVPHIDTTGLNALREFHSRCRRAGTVLLLGGVHAHPMFEMTRAGFVDDIGTGNIHDNLDDALKHATAIIGSHATSGA
ncbi:MAG: STAS domain-containing protein [Planctomycetota bacterium]|nr:MAG: STAS domain-containing protein [Planctomycetota bacterium]